MISVVMGVHRIDSHVFSAIDSILSQRNIEFELIVVANGAKCEEIVEVVNKQYPCNPRLRTFATPVGQLAHALNMGLSLAKYDLIARMDADDVSHSDRLVRQARFLNERSCDLVGCAVRLIDTNGNVFGTRVGARGGQIRRKLPFANTFVHPTILARKQILLDAGGYSGGFNCEDYDLWLRLRRTRIRWDNMPDVLLDYRIHAAAAQRRLLGYAETTGLMMREFALSKNPMWLLAVAIGFAKMLIRSR